ncbi:hypothetical protein ACQ4PT_029578 [Festuca glaucescens]
MAAMSSDSDDGGGAGGAGGACGAGIAGGAGARSGGVARDDAAGGDFPDGMIRISTGSAEDANLRSAAQPSPEQRAATAFARAVVATPCKSSHRWASSFGGNVDLDDEIWEIRFHFSGEDNLERTIGISDITVLNLLALVEQRGYGIRDYMYYVKERGKGKKGMEVVDSMSKVDEMVQLYDSEKVLNLTVLKHKAEWPIGLNRDDGEATNLVDVPVVLSDNKSGINFMAEQAEEVYPVAIDYSDVLYLGTQQSSNSNMNKGKGKEVVESDEDEEDLEDGYDSEKEVDDNEAVRIDPNTTVDTLIDNANQKWGVPIPKSKAYRARKIAFSVVMGDQKAQYIRLRDYLQAVIDTNPGSRCIVTTKHVVEHPSTNPRFHGLFYCLNASKEGFLNGCRPFIDHGSIDPVALGYDASMKVERNAEAISSRHKGVSVLAG